MENGKKDLEQKGKFTSPAPGNGHGRYHGTADSDLEGGSANLDGDKFGGQHGGRQNTQSPATRQNLEPRERSDGRDFEEKDDINDDRPILKPGQNDRASQDVQNIP
jgi:hypothetical protein